MNNAFANKSARIFVNIIFFSVLWFLAASCASLANIPKDLSSLELLPKKAFAYAKLDADSFRDLAINLDKRAAPAITELAKRSQLVYLAFTKNAYSKKPDFFAVAEGNYPARAASMMLKNDKAWKKEGTQFALKNGGIYLAFAGYSRIIFSSQPINPALEAIYSRPDYAVPEYSFYKETLEHTALPIAIYLPEPLSFFTDYVPVLESGVPLKSLLLTADNGAKDFYLAKLDFEFDSARSSRIYAPLCRVFLYAAANMLWPERAATVLDAALWSTDGSHVMAANLPLDVKAVAVFAAQLWQD